jgi:hypothetical protein
LAYATVSDVEARLGRTLEPSESQIVTTRLNDIELMIRHRVPDLDTKVATGVIDPAVVVMVECDAILRLVRNPDGYTAETDGNYSYQISKEVASGRLDILSGEWALLGIRNGAFTIRPSLAPLYGSCPFPWENVHRPFDELPEWDRTTAPSWCDFATGDIKCPC